MDVQEVISLMKSDKSNDWSEEILVLERRLVSQHVIVSYRVGADEDVFGPFPTREAATLWAVENLGPGSWDYGVLRDPKEAS